MTYEQISPEKARNYMAQGDAIAIIDVRTKEEYASGHIKGSFCLPNEEISGTIRELPDKTQPILVYCRSGIRSKEAAQKLADLGYTHVLEFGGLVHWPYDELVEKMQPGKIRAAKP